MSDEQLAALAALDLATDVDGQFLYDSAQGGRTVAEFDTEGYAELLVLAPRVARDLLRLRAELRRMGLALGRAADEAEGQQ